MAQQELRPHPKQSPEEKTNQRQPPCPHDAPQLPQNLSTSDQSWPHYYSKQPEESRHCKPATRHRARSTRLTRLKKALTHSARGERAIACFSLEQQVEEKVQQMEP